MSISIGAVAPDFALKDQHGQTVTLADYRGSKDVLLIFYPWSFTGICSSELDQVQEALPQLQSEGVQVLAVSCDAMFTQRMYAEGAGLTFPVLSDFWPHGAVASAYHVFDEDLGVAVRGSFVIHRDGIVRWQVVNAVGAARDLAEATGALEQLRG